MKRKSNEFEFAKCHLFAMFIGMVTGGLEECCCQFNTKRDGGKKMLPGLDILFESDFQKYL